MSTHDNANPRPWQMVPIPCYAGGTLYRLVDARGQHLCPVYDEGTVGIILDAVNERPALLAERDALRDALNGLSSWVCTIDKLLAPDLLSKQPGLREALAIARAALALGAPAPAPIIDETALEPPDIPSASDDFEWADRIAKDARHYGLIDGYSSTRKQIKYALDQGASRDAVLAAIKAHKDTRKTAKSWDVLRPLQTPPPPPSDIEVARKAGPPPRTRPMEVDL